jgi:hypothetical protein
MRTRPWVGIALLAAALSGVVAAQETTAKDFVGRWEGQRQAEGRLDHLAFVMRDTGKGLAGEVYLNDELFSSLSDFVLAGTKVTFSGAGLDFVGTLDKQTLTVTAIFEGRDLWTTPLTKKDKG